MLSSIFIGLLQAAAGDPAAAAAAETPAVEAPAAASNAAPRTERRRVCREYAASTGGRLPQRRCRYEEVPVRDTPAEAVEESAQAETTEAAPSEDRTGGGTPAASAPSSPQ